MIRTAVETKGLRDIAERIKKLGLNAKDLRRPNAFIGKEMVQRNRRRLGKGVDVHGRKLSSKLAERMGLVPLGGADGLFGRSIHWEIEGADVNLYSDFIGARVAYDGAEITPKNKQWLTIPLEASGGELMAGSKAGRFLSSGLTLEDNRTGRRALHYKETFFLRVNGKLFLVQHDSRKRGPNKGKLRFLFYLTKRTRYPKNEWLGFSADDLEMATEQYSKHLDTFAA